MYKSLSGDTSVYMTPLHTTHNLDLKKNQFLDNLKYQRCVAKIHDYRDNTSHTHMLVRMNCFNGLSTHITLWSERVKTKALYTELIMIWMKKRRYQEKCYIELC